MKSSQSIKVNFELDFEIEEIENIIKTSDKFISLSIGKYKLQLDRFIELREANEKNAKTDRNFSAKLTSSGLHNYF